MANMTLVHNAGGKHVDPIEDLVADVQAGKMVILMDDEDRENEGDLVCAAEHVTPQVINFMAKYGRGLVCLALTETRCAEFLDESSVAWSITFEQIAPPSRKQHRRQMTKQIRLKLLVFHIQSVIPQI